MKLIKEIIKNIKVVLRSWASLSLLILGPLFLILLIGYTFSNESPHDIRIGIHTEQEQAIETLLQNMSVLGEVIKYTAIDPCLADLRKQQIHLCLEIHGLPAMINNTYNSINNVYSKGLFTFYFDDSNKKLSKLLIPKVNEIIGERSSELSLIATRTILDQIQEMVFYVNSKQEGITSLESNLTTLREHLVLRQQKLQNISDQFTPRYVQLKQLQMEIDMQFVKLHASQENVSAVLTNMQRVFDDVQMLLREFATVETTTAIPDLHNITAVNIDDEIITIVYTNATEVQYNISTFPKEERLRLYLDVGDILLIQLDGSLTQLTEYQDVMYKDLLFAKQQFDMMMLQLDAVKQLLDDELAFTEASVAQITTGLGEINATRTDIQEKLSSLKQLDPSLAETIINPIIKEYRAIVSFRTIETVFPGLLVMVTVFITLLLSNILMLSELNAEAYFRNSFSPASSLLTPLGVLFSTYVLVLFQVTILLIIARLQFDVTLLPALGEIYLLLALLITFFTLVGMSCAYLVRSQEISVLFTTFVALGFYLFSSIVTPLELMPKFASIVASLNPVVIGETLLRQLLLYDISLTANMQGISMLGAGILIFGSLVLYFNKRVHDGQ